MKGKGIFFINPVSEWSPIVGVPELDWKERGRPAIVIVEIDAINLVFPLTENMRKTGKTPTWKPPQPGFLFHNGSESGCFKDGYINTLTPFGFLKYSLKNRTGSAGSYAYQALFQFLVDVLDVSSIGVPDGNQIPISMKNNTLFDIHLVNFGNAPIPSIVLSKCTVYDEPFSIVIQSIDHSQYREIPGSTCFKTIERNDFALLHDKLENIIPFHLLSIRTISERRIGPCLGVLTKDCSYDIKRRLVNSILLAAQSQEGTIL